jgi:formate-nitrite transporter family protein
MGLSLIAGGLLQASLPDEPWRPLVANLGYTVGFLAVILGRQQLFTENTVTAIIPVLDDTRKVEKLCLAARLWAIVLAGNLAGALGIAFAVAHSGAFSDAAKGAFLDLGMKTLSYGFGTVLIKGIFAGWIIALLVWLLPASQASRLSIIVILTYIVGIGSLSHVIAGSVDAMYAAATGAATWGHYLAGFLLPSFLGNSIGGVLLVSLLNYGQVAVKGDNEEA